MIMPVMNNKNFNTIQFQGIKTIGEKGKQTLGLILNEMPVRMGDNLVLSSMSILSGKGKKADFKLLDNRGIGERFITLLMNNNRSLKVDYQTGEILQMKKPFFVSKNKLVSKFNDYLTQLHNDIADSKKIEKKTLKILTFSKEQIDILKSIVK